MNHIILCSTKSNYIFHPSIFKVELYTWKITPVSLLWRSASCAHMHKNILYWTSRHWFYLWSSFCCCVLFLCMDSSQSHNLFRNEWNESLDIICRYMNQSFYDYEWWWKNCSLTKCRSVITTDGQIKYARLTVNVVFLISRLMLMLNWSKKKANIVFSRLRQSCKLVSKSKLAGGWLQLIYSTTNFILFVVISHQDLPNTNTKVGFPITEPNWGWCASCSSIIHVKETFLNTRSFRWIAVQW